MGVVKAKALGNKYPQLSEWRRKSEKTRTPKNFEEGAAKAKYNTFRDIYDKISHKTYSAHGGETYKQRTQQNFHSR